jgi:hypothetical protein
VVVGVVDFGGDAGGGGEGGDGLVDVLGGDELFGMLDGLTLDE